MRTDHARAVRWALTEPRALCEKLGLLEGSKRQARGVLIRCPVHGDRNPSCSVTTGTDGTIRVKCFACEFAGDALSLIAHVHGLSLSREDFGEVLAVGAELSGNLALASDIRGGQLGAPRAPVAVVPPKPVAEAEYPDADDVQAIWEASGDPTSNAKTFRLLVARRIDPVAVARNGLARALPPHGRVPSWATYRGRSWSETGHLLVLPAFDHEGALRSVRSWRVVESDAPKRLPPAGKKAAGLVQANRLAVGMLRRSVCPLRLWVVEGEPDYLATATTFGAADAVIGIGSGAWNQDFAARVPLGTRVYVSTHADRAGDQYAEQVIASLSERHMVWRWRMSA